MKPISSILIIMTFCSLFNSELSHAAWRDFYIGTLSNATNNPQIEPSKGIYRGRFNDQTGEIKIMGLAAPASRPSYVVKHPQKNFYYSVSENANSGTGQIDAWKLNSDGSLKKLNSQSSGGQGPCHLTVHPSGKCLFAANYNGGQASMIQIDESGKLGAVVAVDAHQGYSTNTARQSSAHAHWVGVDPAGKRVLCCDLGCDKIYSYLLSDSFDTWTANPKYPFAQVSSGSGCRHGVFSPDGNYLFVLNELACTMEVFKYNSQTGAMISVQVTPTLPPEFYGDNKAAAIVCNQTIDSSGKKHTFVYCSNRGANLITVFAVDDKNILPEKQEAGTIAVPVEYVPCSGELPRFIGVDPSGRFLLSCNKKTCNIAVFAIDPQSGKLTDTGYNAQVGWPVSIAW